ncbi:hypothetical protein OIU34_24155 [Pararhizobium sp. BT-229]|uniref:hypothetical protein n=1 Tax=Pararhizobium sp. BT-229 TaxID=2986923 RepID=UPI0021F748EC|nr:hypothetical protein [Pararhizobium sp. BT-229]MCV9964993.1 hypothetical protein [Pararhizobium sp. BT-229]
MTNLGNENLRADDETTKRRAYSIKERLQELGHKVPLTHAYEILATSCGFRNWPTMKAALESSTTASSWQWEDLPQTGAPPSPNNPPLPGRYLATVGQSEFRLADGTEVSYRSILSSGPGAAELVYAPPGCGKSFLLNALNVAAVNENVAFKGWDGLPEIGIVDIGPSSKGLVELVRERLPPEIANKAAYHRLRVRASDAINPFDTPLGLRRPPRKHLDFLVNFLLTMVHGVTSDPLKKHSPEYYGSFRLSIASAVGHLYEEHADGGKNPKLFTFGRLAEVDREVERLGIEVKLGETTWWRVVDGLYDAGRYAHARMAQRHAVPLLSDILPVLADRHELLSSSIGRWLADLPVLAVPTRIEKGESLITVVDLSDVAPVGGGDADTQTALMYMLARHFLCSSMFLTKADLAVGKYRLFHMDRVRRAEKRVRIVEFDELHRVSSIPPVMHQVGEDLVNAKDRGIRIRLASQALSSFDSAMVHAATNIFVAGVSIRDAATIGEQFGLSAASVAAVTDMPLPSKNGMSFLAVVRESGIHEHLVSHSQKADGLWALTTNTVDTLLRQRVQELVGLAQALRALGRHYPTGSAAREVETRMRNIVGGRSLLDPAFNNLETEIIEQLATELATLSASENVD